MLLLDFSAGMTLPDRSRDVCGYEADAGQEGVCKKNPAPTMRLEQDHHEKARGKR
jgi:hypothetical protein